MNSTSYSRRLGIFAVLTILAFALTPFLAGAQQTDSLPAKERVEITMKNGDKYTGILLSEDAEYMLIQTENGEVKLIKANVLRIGRFSKTGKYAYDNPHYTRYFFGPSAMPLQKGKGYYQNLMLTTNFVNYGLTKNISVGGGIEFISLFAGQPIWFFTPKVGFDAGKNFYAGGGAFVAGMAGEGNVALLYGAGSYGSKDNNLCVGAGFGYSDGELTEYPALMLSGVGRTGRKTSLLTENYIIPVLDGSTYLGIHGLRIMTRESAFDIGGIFIPGLGFPLPFAGFATMF